MQGSNQHLLHWQADSLPSEPPGVFIHLLLLVHAFKRIFVIHVLLSVQLLLQVSVYSVGIAEHLHLEMQTQPTLPQTPALGYLVGF